MQEATITELDSNLSFEVKIDNPPEIKQNFATVYIDDKEVKRPNVIQSIGLIEVKAVSPSSEVNDFLLKWKDSKKRIDLMLETGETMYFMKGCSIKKFESPKKAFSVFYNSFKQA